MGPVGQAEWGRGYWWCRFWRSRLRRCRWDSLDGERSTGDAGVVGGGEVGDEGVVPWALLVALVAVLVEVGGDAGWRG